MPIGGVLTYYCSTADVTSTARSLALVCANTTQQHMSKVR
jgi:hypothetical protein